jgi:DNA-binding MarR family transcriptional regulator
VPKKAASSDAAATELRRLVQKFVREFGLLDQNHTPCGKPLPVSHAHALMVLLERDAKRGAMTQKELGQELGIDKSNIARLCQRMEEEGHAEQLRSDTDGRARFVRLTPRGQELASEVEAASRARFSGLLEGMPPAEHDTVLQGLRLLASAVTASQETEPARPPPLHSSRRDRR